MKIVEVRENKKEYIELLLLADEEEKMIDKYIERGIMFVLDDYGVKGECVVTVEDSNIIEIKNIAVYPKYHNMGYGKKLITFVENRFKKDFNILRVGTGESNMTVPFYERLGFNKSFRISNFFIDNYEKPIYEGGIQLIDMIYLEKNI